MSSALKLYVYEHCPFCARARLALGLKKVAFELVYLQNEDEATPIGLVGSKQVPILITPEGKAMAESMDIVKYVDQNFGGDSILKPSAERAELQQWMKESWPVFLELTHARFHQTPFAEFARLAGRDYYRKKKEHALGASFEALLEKSPELISKANDSLVTLEGLMHSNRSVNEELSIDDVDLFGRLRGITIVKGIYWPKTVREYVDHYAKEGDIQLFDRLAF